MDLGLGNLDTLKSGILAVGANPDDQFDPLLAQIGKSTAAWFENYTGRKFGRVEAVTEDFPSANFCLFLSRYPVESVADIALRDAYSPVFISSGTSQVIGMNELAGMIQLAWVNSLPSTLRVTYTGGYFYETEEPLTNGTSNPNYGTATGMYALPADLQGAWIEQCQANFEYRMKLGAGVMRESGTLIADLQMLKTVRSVLHQYIRRGP